MQLITDRTQADVLEGTEKGHYTPRDLDRVELAVEELCGQMRRMDILLPLQTCLYWQQRPVPTRESMERYLHNVRTVMQALALTAELPESMENLNYQGANQIELALMKAQSRVAGVLESYQMSGELFAGEER